MRYVVTVSTLLVVILFIACAVSQSCPNGTLLQSNFCSQDCNNATCSMSCSSIPGHCIQLCKYFGFCPAVKCSTSRECTQACRTGSDCGSMTCDSQKCTQACQGGSCKKITCDSPQCTQICNEGSDCGSMTCDSQKCTQVCQGSCKKITCDSPQCTQICTKGGCIMECTDKAQSCTQSCTKDCTFICNAKDPATQCRQACIEGGCKYVGPPMNKKTTCDSPPSDQQRCIQNGCPYENCHMDCSKANVPQNSCNQNCYPPIIPCPKTMTCDTAKCFQTCLGKCQSVECSSSNLCVQQCSGKCKSARCTSKTCSQHCSDGACALECANGTEICNQICMNGTSCTSLISKASRVETQFCRGNCDSMQCSSPFCTQECGGNCPKMTCNGDTCNQECSGESCEMHCPKSVKSCTQTCKRGKCKLLCEAETCKKNCTGSIECSEVQPTTEPKSYGSLSRLDLTLLVNGVFLAVITVLRLQ